jgi:hypothetical protein
MVEGWLSRSPRDDFHALTSEVSNHFDQDPAKACEIAWRLYRPSSRSGFTFLGLERQIYADAAKAPQTASSMLGRDARLYPALLIAFNPNWPLVEAADPARVN